MILTSVIGMLLATPQWVPIDILILGNLGIALCAGSAAAVNVVDRHVDDKMARTANRPIAQGRLTPNQAILFAMLTGLAAWRNINHIYQLTYRLANPGISYRLRIYLHYVLKRATPQNIANWWPCWRLAASSWMGSCHW